MKSVLFRLGDLPVHAYGASIAVAFLFAVWHIRKLAGREGIPAAAVYDSAIAAILSAIVGSRLFFVLQPSNFGWYAKHPAEIVKLWNGGLVFYGGLIGCVIVLPFVFRAHKIRFWNIADCFAPAVALGHGFVRLGCFMNGCCYGKAASWGLVFPEIGDRVPRQPSQLYEAATGVLLFALLMWQYPRRKFRGQGFLTYLALYAVARFSIEFTRDDPRGGWSGLSTSQWVAVAAALAVTGLWPWLKKREAIPEAKTPARGSR